MDNTVGLLADAAAKKVDNLRPKADKEIKSLERKRREWKRSTEEDAAKHIADPKGEIEKQKRRLLEPFLALKILDPAMGSGHFLVGTADFLSARMAAAAEAAGELLLALEQATDEDPQTFYKRLAVELAKLSLWLHTVSADKALSFLDHHLRCGNSPIGARVEDDLMKEPPQFDARGRRTNAEGGQLVLGFSNALTATHLQYSLDTFQEIMETPTATR
ncbi:MAG: hypothetical protein CO095_11325 [Armatimonadetes bacterium CG_4_9_14_3_um_filter_58_7]|nr:MAG: hypothetical protein CO095_11325 [Armatimonadetes bacterium CG_4_9_14_3_um_filter_58_7]